MKRVEFGPPLRAKPYLARSAATARQVLGQCEAAAVLFCLATLLFALCSSATELTTSRDVLWPVAVGLYVVLASVVARRRMRRV